MKLPIIMRMRMIKYLCIVLVLQGCYSEHKALKDLNKANKHQPKVVSDFAREHFPCNITDSIIKIDTTYNYVTIPCPGRDPLSSDITIVDTIYLNKVSYKTNVVKQVVAVPSKTITITKWYEDSAKIKSLSLTISQTQSELNNYKQKKETDSNWIKWLVICLCISIILNIVQSRK